MNTSSVILREGLTPLPKRMTSLPLDSRGYPVPWFVAWPNGEPDFRVIDHEKIERAIHYELCWICGERLGRHQTFVFGPSGGIQRLTLEPPSHHECATWAAQNCPFCANPSARHRTHNMPDGGSKIDEHAILHNPGVFLCWTTDQYFITSYLTRHVVLSVGEPTRVEWYRRGKLATPEEALAALERAGEELKALKDQGPPALKEKIERLREWLPKPEIDPDTPKAAP